MFSKAKAKFSSRRLSGAKVLADDEAEFERRQAREAERQRRKAAVAAMELRTGTSQGGTAEKGGSFMSKTR